MWAGLISPPRILTCCSVCLSALTCSYKDPSYSKLECFPVILVLSVKHLVSIRTYSYTVVFLYVRLRPGVWGATTIWGMARLSPCR